MTANVIAMKTFLIAGGGSGIGLATAKVLVERLSHPQLGPLELAVETVVSDAGQSLVTSVAAPGSPSEEALRLPASLAVT